MTGQSIDGKAIALRVRAEVKERADAFVQRYDRKPGLDVVLIGDDPASEVYVRNKEVAARKAGFNGNVHRLSQGTSQADAEALVQQLNETSSVDGILVQLPLPKHLDAAEIVRRIEPKKDVDGLHPFNVGLLCNGEPGLRPCTPLGCIRLLDEIACQLQGKHAVVVGRSNLVGKPLAWMLLERHATVSIAHSRTTDLPRLVGDADIVVAAVGRPQMIRGPWLKPGAVVLDVGINRLADGTLVGDVHYAEAMERASFVTPVPGGVGPMTIAMLLSNTLQAAQARID